MMAVSAHGRRRQEGHCDFCVVYTVSSRTSHLRTVKINKLEKNGLQSRHHGLQKSLQLRLFGNPITSFLFCFLPEAALQDFRLWSHLCRCWGPPTCALLVIILAGTVWVTPNILHCLLHESHAHRSLYRKSNIMFALFTQIFVLISFFVNLTQTSQSPGKRES